MSPDFTYGETKVAYTESRGLKVTFDSLARLGELEYVMIPGVGEAQDFQGLDLAGKVAVAQRGSIPFSKKLANAEAAGAVGLIVYDNSDAAELIAMDYDRWHHRRPGGREFPAMFPPSPSARLTVRPWLLPGPKS